MLDACEDENLTEIGETGTWFVQTGESLCNFTVYTQRDETRRLSRKTSNRQTVKDIGEEHERSEENDKTDKQTNAEV